MDILERDITSKTKKVHFKEKGKEPCDISENMKWEDIALQSIHIIPAKQEIDIIEVKNDEEILKEDNESLKNANSKRNKIAIVKDVIVKLGVESVEICCAFPLLPVMVTADYFSSSFGKKVKKACYKYREFLFNAGRNIENLFGVKS